MITLVEIFYFDGDVGNHVGYLRVKLLAYSMILGMTANSIGDIVATAAYTSGICHLRISVQSSFSAHEF